MSERLEKYVRKHQDEFDLMTPDSAIWDRIDKKLGKKSGSRNLSYLWKAAAVLVIFGFSFWAQMQIEEQPQRVTYQNYHKSNSEKPQVPEADEPLVIAAETESNLIPEFVETEKYYSKKVTNTMKDLRIYLVKYPEVADDMKKDLAELDSVYRTLKKDLGDNIAQEEILSAMIQNYRMKLQLLEDIKSELMHSASKPNTKNSSHEI
jgi:hypothetical protein